MIAALILWRATPGWVKGGALALIVLAGAFYAGRQYERAEWRAEMAQRKADTIERIEHADPGDLADTSDTDVDDGLRALSE